MCPDSSSPATLAIGNRLRQTRITGYCVRNELTSGRRVLEKLIVAQLAKKFPAVYRNRRFIMVLTRARHKSQF